MKLAFASGCLIGIFLLGGCATAPKTVTVEELFQRADKDGNGSVSRTEYEDFMITQMFALYDDNGDGVITEAEFVADGGTPETFRRLNASGSGKLTLDEALNSTFLRQRLAAPFNEADVNRSGSVTWEEFQIARAKRDAVVR